MTTSSVRPLSNPAQLSTLSALFPLPVVVAELQQSLPSELVSGGRRGPELITEREWDSIRHCAERRIRDFCAGRWCARRALAEFGVFDFDLLAAADRQPLWPPSLTGSITHTEGYSAAVVGERRILAGVGIDAERIDAVRADLWPPICAPVELERLRALPADSQAITAALTFVAKEAFFKCQYPLAGERFEFEEVQLEDADWGASSGRFRLALQRTGKLDRFLPESARHRIEGRFRRLDQFLIAGVALPPI